MGQSGGKALNPLAQQFVKESIGKQKVVIFSKSYCPYCTIAKKPFQELNQEYLAIEIENRPDCDDIQDVLQDLTNARSVPRVFINGKFVGGGSDVKNLYENGQLKEMLS